MWIARRFIISFRSEVRPHGKKAWVRICIFFSNLNKKAKNVRHSFVFVLPLWTLTTDRHLQNDITYWLLYTHVTGDILGWRKPVSQCRSQLSYAVNQTHTRQIYLIKLIRHNSSHVNSCYVVSFPKIITEPSRKYNYTLK